MTQAQIDQLNLDYQGRIGSLMAVDDHVAKMVRILHRTNELRNTMIVFLSDNGWVQGEHRIQGDKYTPYEESVQVPFIIRGPGVAQGRTMTKQVSDIDFAGTLLDAAGGNPPRKEDGISLLPVARRRQRAGPGDRARGDQPAVPRPGLPVSSTSRTRGCAPTATSTSSGATGRGSSRPAERPVRDHNLVGRSGYASVLARMKADLAKLRACKGASCQVAP